MLILKKKLENARGALGSARSDSILSELKRAKPSGVTLKEMVLALEAAMPRAKEVALPKSAAAPLVRHSSILDLAPDPAAHDGAFSPRYAAALIRFYTVECKTDEERAAFSKKFKAYCDVSPFADLGIVAAIRAGAAATRLDLRVFEARAEKEAPPLRQFIRHGRHN